MIPLPTVWPTEPKTRFAHVELQINTACDLACFGCDRFSDVVNDHNMSMGQVALFVEESFKLDWRWERIRLLGGEPTLHPHFNSMVNLLLKYRERYPGVFLQVLTNGQGKAALHRKWLEAEGISLHAEYKEKGVQPDWFHNTRIVMVDRLGTDCPPLPPCGIFGTHGCGLGLTRYGWFIDGAGASVARVAGLDIGCQRLADFTWEKMMEQARVLCRICGHWNPMDWTDPPVYHQTVTQKVKHTGPVTGKFWREKLIQYNREKPKMTIYGEGA